MQDACLYLIWKVGKTREEVAVPINQVYENEYFMLDPFIEKHSSNQLYQIKLIPKIAFSLEEVFVKVKPQVEYNDKMMVNGYQTWTQSRESSAKEKNSRLCWMVNPLLGPYGDYNLYKTSGKKGHFHSWTYTYFRRNKDQILFLGSIDESFAFTIFDYNYSKNELKIKKEINNMLITDNSIIFKVYIGEGEEENIWDEYSSLLNKPMVESKKITGWTSWYYYYTNITEEIILENLNNLAEKKIPLDVFQIDDGYQKALGDWLEVNNKFPSGMAFLAEKIRKKGYKPGLWLAPFVCDKESEVYKNHPEWLLRDKKGRVVKAGWNPGWNGWFYSLDFYAPGFQDYLKNVFEVITKDWGYEMIKLDFLYAAALVLRSDKTRGQIMEEVMNFIRENLQDRWLLGCGVPLGSAFGKTQYCRIGSDVGPYWEDHKLKMVKYRERVSTINSLLSTLGRWQLNSRVFLSDPDVFILRDNEVKLNFEERYTLFLVNNLLGGLVFFSDNIAEYSPAQLNLLRSMYPVVSPVIKKVEEENKLYHISFKIKDNEYHAYINLREKPYNIQLKRPVFISTKGYLPEGENLVLAPHQSICLYYFKESKNEAFLLGSSGHLFPGAQVETFDVSGSIVNLTLNKDASSESKIFIGAPARYTNLKINDKYYSIKINKQGLRYVLLTRRDFE